MLALLGAASSGIDRPGETLPRGVFRVCRGPADRGHHPGSEHRRKPPEIDIVRAEAAKTRARTSLSRSERHRFRACARRVPQSLIRLQVALTLESVRSCSRISPNLFRYRAWSRAWCARELKARYRGRCSAFSGRSSTRCAPVDYCIFRGRSADSIEHYDMVHGLRDSAVDVVCSSLT
jgi:hypothetical protein